MSRREELWQAYKKAHTRYSGIGFKLRCNSDLIEGLTNVVQDILNVFKTNGETNEAGVDAAGNELLLCELTVSFTCRMKNAGADICNVNLV